MNGSRAKRSARALGGLAAASVFAVVPFVSAAPEELNDLHLGRTWMQSAQSGGAAGGAADEVRTLDGPYYLRSADAIELGEVEVKFIYSYARGPSDDEEHEGEFEIEWGFAPNLEFIMEVGTELFDGRVEGNGDIEELGVHWQLCDQDGLRPAFAMRHLVRIPTGTDSDGVDYTARGIMTWKLTEAGRLHFDPYITSINGNLDDNERNLRWGAAIGVDWKLNDTTVVIFDYLHQNSEEYGQRNQHSVEFGLDWEFAEDQLIGLGVEMEIDGDSYGDDYSASISYIYEFEP